MSKDKQSKFAASTEHDDSKVTLTNLNGIEELKSIDFDHSSGFTCDINTGVCGPVTNEKEGEE